jgi:hypothetical protein
MAPRDIGIFVAFALFSVTVGISVYGINQNFSEAFIAVILLLTWADLHQSSKEASSALETIQHELDNIRKNVK